MSPLLGAYALSALGGGYQTVAEFHDRRTHQAPGQLVDVAGHRLHLLCVGSGTPTVILESGLGEAAAYWGWISTAVAQDTRVCTYDRAGRGWSDPAAVAQDGIAVATDMHVHHSRRLIQQMVMECSHINAALLELQHHGFNLVLQKDQISH